MRLLIPTYFSEVSEYQMTIVVQKMTRRRGFLTYLDPVCLQNPESVHRVISKVLLLLLLVPWSTELQETGRKLIIFYYLQLELVNNKCHFCEIVKQWVYYSVFELLNM